MTHPEPVAVVTGANRGLGLEVCRQLAGRGYAVVLGSRDPRKGRRAAARLGDAPNVVPCQLDVADDDSVLLRSSGRGRIVNVSSAASVVWGVTLPDNGPTGGFFRDGRPLRW
jgi:uncharacterized protein YbjT (DUF2867 family)